jgi:uncharacterized lipoprotein YajG
MGIKKTIFLLVTLVSPALSASERVPIALKLPEGFVEQLCSAPIWKQRAVVWKGVQDKRTSPELGAQSKKETVIAEVVAEPSLAESFDKALQKILTQCGLKLVSQGNDESTYLSVEVVEFHAGLEKKLLTGKGMAKSRLILNQGTPYGGAQTIEIEYEIESKKVRSKSIKQLSQTLNELFQKTLEKIPQIKELRA